MADGMKIEVKGLEQIVKQLGNLPEAVAIEVDAQLSAIAEEFANRAVAMAPMDQSMLKQGISHKRNGLMDHEVVSSAAYSAFVEFGTRSRVSIPSGQEAYAAEFKGMKISNGGFYEFALAILAWMKRKGISAGTYSTGIKKFKTGAYAKVKEGGRRVGTKAQKFEEDLRLASAIAYSILKQGIHPHPFFFPQLPVAERQIELMQAVAVDKALGK